jgi:hypothetical protein
LDGILCEKEGTRILALSKTGAIFELFKLSSSKFNCVGTAVPGPVPVAAPGAVIFPDCPGVFKRVGRRAGLGLVIGLGAALEDVELAPVE